MDSMLQYKEKYPILCNLLGDKYINAPMNSKDSGSLKSLLINDDIFLAQLNEILEKLSNKTTFPEGNLKSIIKHLKSPGVQFFNTLSEICLMNYFLKEKHLNGYEIPFAVNDKIGDFDLQIEYKGNEYFIDVLNIELVEDDRMKDFVFPLTGCIKEDLDNIIERKIVKKAKDKQFSSLKAIDPYKKFGIAIDYTKNQKLYVEIKSSKLLFPKLFADFGLKVFDKYKDIDCLIFYEYIPYHELIASNVEILSRESIKNENT